MTVATPVPTRSAVATDLVTTASTELRYPAHRELRTRIPLATRLRHAEAIAVACWRGMLALASVLVVLGSIYTISLYGPHPVTSGAPRRPHDHLLRTL